MIALLEMIHETYHTRRVGVVFVSRSRIASLIACMLGMEQHQHAKSCTVRSVGRQRGKDTIAIASRMMIMLKY